MRRSLWRICVAGLTLAGPTTLASGCKSDPCEVRPGQLCRIAGTGEYGYNGDGLDPKKTDLFLPSAARMGPDGLRYIMDFNNQRLRRIGEDGRMETLVGSGFHALANVDLPLTDTPLENPIDFRFLSDGRIIFVSYHDPRVLVLADDGTLDTIAGAADGVTGVTGDEGDNGPAMDALFIQLDGIAVASDDTIYVSDSLANRVRKIEGGIITTVAGNGQAGYSGDGGPGTEASLFWPTALELDDEGNLLIADTFNHVVRRLEPDGTITTVVGSGTQGDEGDGGPALGAQLSEPYGLALDDDGTLYIADRGNFRIRRVQPNGTVHTVAGTGREGTAKSGSALSVGLGYCGRIALDPAGLLIVDQSNSKLLQLGL